MRKSARGTTKVIHQAKRYGALANEGQGGSSLKLSKNDKDGAESWWDDDKVLAAGRVAVALLSLLGVIEAPRRARFWELWSIRQIEQEGNGGAP